MIPGALQKPFMDKFYVFFDETNNVRKITLDMKKQNGLNEVNLLFVLGGVMFEHDHQPERIKRNFNNFFYNNSITLDGVNEYKFKEFAGGGSGKDEKSFKKLLNSKKLNFFLQWMIKKKAYIHYSATDLRYFIFVDLLESDELIDEIHKHSLLLPKTLIFDNEVMMFHLGIKTFFDKAILFNQKQFFEELYKIGFPDVKENDIEKLRKITLDHFESYINSEITSEEDDKYIKPIKRILENNDFYFMIDKPDHPNRLMDSFSFIYFNRILSFNKSKVCLDNEYNVENDFNTYKGEKPDKSILNGLSKVNCVFESSDKNIMLQISDIVVGLVKELYVFCGISKNSLNNWGDYLENFSENLTDRQMESIKLFCKLHQKSLTLYNGIQQTTMPIDTRLKFDYMCKYFSSFDQ